jgi:hypothetical protein
MRLKHGILGIAAVAAAAAVCIPSLAKEKRPVKCAVHQVVLQHGSARIVYGLVRYSPDRIEAERELFPHSNRVSLGGCTVRPDAPRTREVTFCPKCRAAEEVWQRQQDARKTGAQA